MVDKFTKKPEENQKNAIILTVGDKKRKFNIYQKELPHWIKDHALKSGGYPYSDKMHKNDYETSLNRLQIELVKMQKWLLAERERVVIIFEGRDAAGKGGTISTFCQYLNPRNMRNVALPKPDETENGQWYFQRYIRHFPTFGECVTFDRSWYNRAGVEAVMQYAKPKQVDLFLMQAPVFEEMMVREGIRFFKIWLDIGQEMQLKRFHDRVHNVLKSWKFSQMDERGMTLWNEYSLAIHRMIEKTHTSIAPWTIVKANDKRRARLAVMRRILLSIPYLHRDIDAIGQEDTKIIGEGIGFL